MNQPKSYNITELPNGDIVYEDSIWWNFDDYNSGRNPVRTNWDDPLNLRLIFDKNGSLREAIKL